MHFLEGLPTPLDLELSLLLLDESKGGLLSPSAFVFCLPLSWIPVPVDSPSAMSDGGIFSLLCSSSRIRIVLVG